MIYNFIDNIFIVENFNLFFINNNFLNIFIQNLLKLQNCNKCLNLFLNFQLYTNNFFIIDNNYFNFFDKKISYFIVIVYKYFFFF
jgi:hypothetical protein